MTNDLRDAARPFPELAEDFRRAPLSLCWKIPGIWLVDKPPGPTSHGVVSRARKQLELKRIGHAGTLDPMAEGLLVLLAGNATRLFDHFQEFSKSYVAAFKLGERTDSCDATGMPLAGWQPRPLPPVPDEDVRSALAFFRGEILQTPPMHSAIKKDGQPLYKLARKGVEVEREARPVTVHGLELTRFDGTTGELAMTVSKGFYVRTLIDDLGLRLGCGAVMTGLRRTAIGPFTVEMAVAPDALPTGAEPSSPARITPDSTTA